MIKHMKLSNLLKRALTFMLAFLLSFATLSVFTVGRTTAKATESKILDMYLLGGQSNALGSSLITGDFNETFSNVGYAMAGDYQLAGQYYGSPTTNIASFSNYKWEVTAGLGYDSNHMGPEYGIAKAINDEYTGLTKAFIFKSAAGGTGLLDRGKSAEHGNWYPRSLWESEPDLKNSTDPTGVQYYLFVENFRNVYQTLVANGYTPVVKGMAWMQGESDLDKAEEYEPILKTFITDIRNDIYEITKDENTRKMPFVIGKIATTFGSYGNTAVPAFNEMQQRVADSMEKVSTVETSDLIIVNKDGSINGTDNSHFNAADVATLGERFGVSMLELSKRIDVSISATKGKVNYEFDVEDNLVFTFEADYNCVLRSFEINGKELLGQVKDDRYVVLSPSETYPQGIEATAVFGDKARYTVTYEDIPSEQGSYVNKAFSCLEGGVLKVKITLKQGYTLVSVKYGEEEMTYNAETGAYEIVPTANGKVVATIEPDGGQPSGSETPGNTNNNGKEDKDKGCGGSIEGVAGVLLLSVLVCAGVVLSAKKRRS